MRAPMAEVSKRGIITIPKSVRDANGIREGQRYGVRSLGRGTLLFTPDPSQVDQMCDSLRDRLTARGASLEAMLEELSRSREGEDA